MQQILQTLSRMGAKALPANDSHEHRFEIASSRGDRTYVLAQRKASGVWGCSCPGAIYHKGHTCKHLRALGLAE